MTYLLIDQGNSRLKFCLSDEQSNSEIQSGTLNDLSAYISAHTNSSYSINKAWICSVRGALVQKELTEYLIQFDIPHEFAETQKQQYGLINSYKEISSMGVDRWCAMLGIRAHCKSGFVLIDAGTAITFDYVNTDGKHQGGHILAGINTMVHSLVDKTDRIDIDYDAVAQTIELAQSTEAAVTQGAMAMVVGYIETMLNSLPKDINVFLTGGDSEAIKELISADCELIENPVFDGLRVYFQ